MNFQVCCYCKSAMEPMGFSLSIMPWNFKFQRAVAAQEMPWNFKFQSFCHAAKGMSCRLFCIVIYNLLPPSPNTQISPSGSASSPQVIMAWWHRLYMFETKPSSQKKKQTQTQSCSKELDRQANLKTWAINLHAKFSSSHRKKIVSHFHF